MKGRFDVGQDAGSGPDIGPRTVAAAVQRKIRSAILAGDFPGGAQLRQDVLAEEYGVSRIPVREALFQLEAEGLVHIQPHRGATVSALSLEGMREAFEMRGLLEPALLRRSAPHLRAEDYAALEAVLAEYEAALAAGDHAAWGPLNLRLHLGLYGRAGRPRMLAQVQGLLQEGERYTRLQLSAAPASQHRAQQEHRAIVTLCQKGDVAGACTALAAHIALVAEELEGLLELAEP